MPATRSAHWLGFVVSAVLCSRCSGSAGADATGEHVSVFDVVVVDEPPVIDVPPRGPPDAGPDTGPCTDTDGDGISDFIEGRYSAPPTDTDGDGTPDYLDTDADNDGILDIDEGIRNYPGFASEAFPPLTCGMLPNNCSAASGLGDWRNLDSDADGVSDHDEVFTWHTDPCNPNTHTDPVTGTPISDALWVAAGGMPPPSDAVYVGLGIFPDSGCAFHSDRTLEFATRIQAADVFFLVGTTGSMAPTLTALSGSLSSTIVPGILATAGSTRDVRIGAGDYRSFPERPDGAPGSDYILHVGQPLTHSYPSVQAFVDGLQAGGGGDAPDPATEAIFQSFVGRGLDPAIHGHDADLTPSHGCAVSSTGSICTAPDSGWASAMNPARDCLDDPSHPTSMGWACFQPGRVPVLVVLSDAAWVHDLHDDCDVGISCSAPPYASASYGSGGHTFAQLSAALNTGGAYFVGIDVGSGDMHTNATQLAIDTATLDGASAPIAPMVPPTAISGAIVSSVATLFNATRQDVTVRVDAVHDSRIAAGHTAADFIKAVTPVGANPPAPVGYDHSDATTFYGVSPTATVSFDIQIFNDFQPQSSSVQVFQVNIVVLGRAGTVLGNRVIYLINTNLGCTI